MIPCIASLPTSMRAVLYADSECSAEAALAPLSAVFVKKSSLLAQVLTTCGAVGPISNFEQKL